MVERWTHADLLHRAQAIAARIEERRLSTADPAPPRILLLAPQGLDYVAGFYGALLAGVIPVTLPAPRSRRSVERVRLVADWTSGRS